MAKAADIPIKISHCHATSPKIGMLENRVLIWIKVQETYDSDMLNWSLIKSIPVTTGDITYGVDVTMNGHQINTLDIHVVSCCFRTKEECDQEKTDDKCE